MASKEDILKRYMTGSKEEKKKTTKKKKAEKGKPPVKKGGLVIVEDTIQVQANFKEEEDEESDDAPTVAEYTVEQHNKPWLGTKADGSGWVAVDPPDAAGGGSQEQQGAKRRRHDSPDLSPPRRPGRHSPPSAAASAAADLSPPRRSRHDSPDLSPPRRKPRASSPGLSPPRRTARHDSTDLSPPRRARHDSPDLSPPRKPVAIKREPADLSPPRRGKSSSSGDHRSSDSSGAQAAGGREGSGAVATGLLSRTQLRSDLDARRRHQEGRLSHMSDEQLGRNASTVFRDQKTGQRVSMTELLRQQKEAAGLEATGTEDEEKGMQWGKGLVQAKMADDKAAYEAREAAKPFARTADDEDLNAALREQQRWGDPMARLLSKGQSQDDKPEKKRKKEKKEKKNKKKDPKILGLRCKFPGLPNRFGIPPGYRWDGVDRSTGYERKMFQKQSENIAWQEQKYLWSVEDM